MLPTALVRGVVGRAPLVRATGSRLPSLSSIAAARIPTAAAATTRGFAAAAGDRPDKYARAPESVGSFKSPIVQKLWSRRKSEMEGENPGAPVDRSPAASRTCITYPFSTDEYLVHCYQNPWGFFRKGKLFEDLDALAGTIAFAHCERDGKVPLLVTASVDRIRLQSNPPLDQDMEMSGAVVWSGSSSMVIDMQVRQVSEPHPWITASFTFVARSPQTAKASKINRLVPETPEEQARFKDIEVRNQKRKAKRQQQAAVGGGGGLANGIGIGGGSSSSKGTHGFNREAMAQLLLSQARPLIEMPCLSDPTCVLVDQTKLSNSTVMQPQQRNQLSRVFGGFLMRRAYEIAFATAYLFGGARPSFYEVAHVDFLSPVDVGDLMRFDSCVLYTHVGDEGLPHVHVQVIANICRPEKTESQRSNTFNFVFIMSEKATVKKILPSNHDQAQRMVQRIEAVLSRD